MSKSTSNRSTSAPKTNTKKTAAAPKPAAVPGATASEYETRLRAAADDFTAWKDRHRGGNALPGQELDGLGTLTTEDVFNSVAGSDHPGDMMIEAARLALVTRYALKNESVDFEGNLDAFTWVLFMIETRCEAAAELQHRQNAAERFAKLGGAA